MVMVVGTFTDMGWICSSVAPYRCCYHWYNCCNFGNFGNRSMEDCFFEKALTCLNKKQQCFVVVIVGEDI